MEGGRTNSNVSSRGGSSVKRSARETRDERDEREERGRAKLKHRQSTTTDSTMLLSCHPKTCEADYRQAPKRMRIIAIPGSISESSLFSPWPVMEKVFAAMAACTFGFWKWITVPSSLIMFT